MILTTTMVPCSITALHFAAFLWFVATQLEFGLTLRTEVFSRANNTFIGR